LTPLRVRQVALLAPVLATLALAGCASRRDRVADLIAAATPAHVQPIVACWEKEYEEAGFRGEYIATVDFEISRAEQFGNAHVTSVEPRGEGASDRDLGPFRACLEGAFADVKLPVDADAGGPGFSTFVSISVRGYKIAFLGDGGERRKDAGARQTHVLLGPRADRCQGLYAYDPPRDTSSLFTEIALAKSRADNARDKDEIARELQKAYDMQIELAARLEADLGDASLPPANRKRLTDELETARAEARATGEVIGCAPVGKGK
jgi:hypothetical protein